MHARHTTLDMQQIIELSGPSLKNAQGLNHPQMNKFTGDATVLKTLFPTSTMAVGVFSWFVLALAAVGTHAATLTLQSPRITMSSSDASQLRSEPSVSAAASGG